MNATPLDDLENYRLPDSLQNYGTQNYVADDELFSPSARPYKPRKRPASRFIIKFFYTSNLLLGLLMITVGALLFIEQRDCQGWSPTATFYEHAEGMSYTLMSVGSLFTVFCIYTLWVELGLAPKGNLSEFFPDLSL